jgi:gamma-tubulin complex component 2
MKHFFFLDQSDFLTNFLDLASSELRKQSKQASLVKLQSLLDLAIRNPGSSSSNDLLIKIVSRTGGRLGDEGGELDFGSGDRFEDDPAAPKTLFGMLSLSGT